MERDEAYTPSDSDNDAPVNLSDDSSGSNEGDDEDDLGIEMQGPSSEAERSGDSVDDFRYSVLTPAEIVEHMIEVIRDVAAIVEMAPTTCRLLLHHFNWNKENLLEAFYDRDQEKVFRDAHVVSPGDRQRSACTSAAAAAAASARGPVVTRCPTELACGICCHTLPISSMTGLECGHIYCTDCWAAYLRNKVMDEGRGQTIACPAHKCEIFVDDAKAMHLIRSEDVRRRYQHLITNSFVECNRLLRWCPSPNCCSAVRVQHFDTKPVTCTCGFTFCFGCGEQWHEPVNCDLLRKWIRKCSDDSETSNWISANTKECPKCRVTIEKDGGCNHMTCKSTVCRMEFCWVCLGPWEPHGSSWYACNRFDDQASRSARDAQERSRAALQRYLHYCNRYVNHQQSLKLENKLYATVKLKMEQMQQANMSWIEVQFLRKAVDVLSQCRRTLMYSYAFAFFLIKNNQTIIFENNQNDLELSTEQLSEFLERDLDKENLVTLKQKVQDKYRYVEGRRQALLKHCAEGTDEGWWQFSANGHDCFTN